MYETVQTRIATAVEFAGQNQAGAVDTVQPGRHFGGGIDPEYTQKNLGGCVDNLLQPSLDHVRMRLNKIVGEPARDKRRQGFGNAVVFHRLPHCPQFGEIVVAAPGGGTQQAYRQAMFGIGEGVGRADHTAERMAGDVNAIMPQFLPQGFEVLHQVVEGIRGRWLWAVTVAAQVVAHTGKAVLQPIDQLIPGGLARSDSVHKV